MSSLVSKLAMPLFELTPPTLIECVVASYIFVYTLREEKASKENSALWGELHNRCSLKIKVDNFFSNFTGLEASQ